MVKITNVYSTVNIKWRFTSNQSNQYTRIWDYEPLRVTMVERCLLKLTTDSCPSIDGCGLLSFILLRMMSVVFQIYTDSNHVLVKTCIANCTVNSERCLHNSPPISLQSMSREEWVWTANLCCAVNRKRQLWNSSRILIQWMSWWFYS